MSDQERRDAQIKEKRWLMDELERQADIYGKFSIRKDDVIRLFSPRPNQLPKELSIPVVTLGKSVYLSPQAEFAGIKFPENYPFSLIGDTAGAVTYEKLRLIWMHDGAGNKGKSAGWVRRSPISNYSHPATLADGIALAIVHPNIVSVLMDHSICFPGSTIKPVTDLFLGSIRPSMVPYLSYDDRRGMFLAYGYDESLFSDWGSALSSKPSGE